MATGPVVYEYDHTYGDTTGTSIQFSEEAKVRWAGVGVLSETETDTREEIYRIYAWIRGGGED